jgi:hypothetical protein
LAPYCQEFVYDVFLKHQLDKQELFQSNEFLAFYNKVRDARHEVTLAEWNEFKNSGVSTFVRALDVITSKKYELEQASNGVYALQS